MRLSHIFSTFNRNHRVELELFSNKHTTRHYCGSLACESCLRFPPRRLMAFGHLKYLVVIQILSTTSYVTEMDATEWTRGVIALVMPAVLVCVSQNGHRRQPAGHPCK